MPEDGLVWTGESYDNTSRAGREHLAPRRVHRAEQAAALDGERVEPMPDRPLRWLMSSDVCKHCTHAACLDVCPTGALFRTEFGTVVVQEDVCNGCGYCVPACPFGVIDKRHLPRQDAAGDPAAGQEGGRPRLEVHALLRPAEGRPRARVREGVPDRLDPVRRARRAARARRQAAREAAGRGLERRAALRPRPGRRRRRLRRVLPAARRAGGLRPAARPGGDDARPARDVADGRARRGRARASACVAGVPRRLGE